MCQPNTALLAALVVVGACSVLDNEPSGCSFFRYLEVLARNIDKATSEH